MVLPYEFEIVFKSLPIEEAGRLILAIYDYEQRNIEPDFAQNPALMFAWNTHIKPKIDENVEKYNAICKARRNAGSKGGRPSQNNQDKPKKANGFFDNQNNQVGAKEPDCDGDCDGDCDCEKEKILKKENQPFSSDGMEIIKLYEERFGTVSSYKATQLDDLVKDFGKDAVAYAVRQANISSAPNVRYIRTTAMNFMRRKEDGAGTNNNASTVPSDVPMYGQGIVV